MHPSGAPERVDPPTHPPPDRPSASQQHQFPPRHLAHLFTPTQPVARNNSDDILSELSAFEMHLDGPPQNPAAAGAGAAFDSIDDVLRAPPTAANPLMMSMQQARQGKQRPPNYPPAMVAQAEQRNAAFRQAQAQRALQLTAQGVHGAHGMQGLALQMQRAQTQKRQRAATAKGQMQHQMMLQQQQLVHHQQLQKRQYSPAQQRTLQGALQSAQRAQGTNSDIQSQAQATLASQQMRDQWRMQQLHQQQQGLIQGSGHQGRNVAQQWLAQHGLPNFKAPVPGMQQPNRTGAGPLDGVGRSGFVHPGQSRGVPQHVASQAQQNHALAARAAAAAAAAAASTPSNGRPPQKHRVPSRPSPAARTAPLSGSDADLTRRVCELEMEAVRKRQRLEAAPSKDQYYALAPDVRRPFADCFDAWRRLLPYHVLLAPDAPSNDSEIRRKKKKQVANIYAKWESSLKEKVASSTAATDDRPTTKAETEAANAAPNDDMKLDTAPLASRDDLLLARILYLDEVAAAEEVRRQKMAAEAVARAKLQAEMQKQAQEQALTQARAWREMQARAQAQSQAQEQASSQQQPHGHEQGQVYHHAQSHNNAQSPLQAQTHQQVQSYQQAQAHARQQAHAHAQQLRQADVSLQSQTHSQSQSHSLPHSQQYSARFSHQLSGRNSQSPSQSGTGLNDLGRLLVPSGMRTLGTGGGESNLHPPRQQQSSDGNLLIPPGTHNLQQQGLQQGLRPPQWAPAPAAAYTGSPPTPSGAPIGGVAAGRAPQ